MANFVLVDHSLKTVGGHHYEYAVHLLRAAHQAGFNIVLATHRKFRGQGDLPPEWLIRPLFRYDIYCRHAFASSRRVRHRATDHQASKRSATGVAPSPGGGWPRWIGEASQMVQALDRRWRLHCFATACARLFRDLSLTSDDHVFLPTLSEFDLRGLVQFLASSSDTRCPQWHLQFHFDVFDGRASEYDRQTERLRILQRRFREALQLVPHHRFHFYCTTPEMAAQYNRLKIGEFRELPYAINPDLARVPRRSTVSHPLRITCAGGIRREKGRERLADTIQKLWRPYLHPRKVQFFIQADPRRFRNFWPRHAIRRRLRDERHSPRGNVALPEGQPTAPLVRVPHPLCTEDYAQLLREADVGMFLYDGRGYYARFSGVLAEMLAVGVPVIVPAGCWLAEQISEPIGEHLDQLRRTAPIIVRHDVTPFQRRRPHDQNDRLVIGPGRPALVGSYPVPDFSPELLVRFRWLQPDRPGVYVRLTAQHYNGQGERVGQFTTILGPRSREKFVSTLLAIPACSSTVGLHWANAYGTDAIALGEVEACFLAAADPRHRSRPAGAVGLIAANNAQIGHLLNNLIEHYSHYRRSAHEFSRQWIAKHGPRHTLATLLDHPRPLLLAPSAMGQRPVRDDRQKKVFSLPRSHDHPSKGDADGADPAPAA